jgi:hypothetical protein
MEKVLLDILGSIRQNVMPGVVGQVAALGPGVVPDLIYILEDDYLQAPSEKKRKKRNKRRRQAVPGELVVTQMAQPPLRHGLQYPTPRRTR